MYFFLPKFKYPTTYSQCLRKLRLNQSGHRDRRLPKFYKTSISRHGFKSFDFNRCSLCIYCQHTPYQRLLHLIRKDQWWSTIPPIWTQPTITSNLKSLNINRQRQGTWEIQILDWDTWLYNDMINRFSVNRIAGSMQNSLATFSYSRNRHFHWPPTPRHISKGQEIRDMILIRLGELWKQFPILCTYVIVNLLGWRQHNLIQVFVDSRPHCLTPSLLWSRTYPLPPVDNGQLLLLGNRISEELMLVPKIFDNTI